MKTLFSLVLTASFAANALPPLSKENLDKGVRVCTGYTKQQLIGEASQSGAKCQEVRLQYDTPKDSNIYDEGNKKTIGAVRVDGQMTMTCGTRKSVYKFQQITSYDGNTYDCHVKPSSAFGY